MKRLFGARAMRFSAGFTPLENHADDFGRRNSLTGFTLLEILVALLIFSTGIAIGVGILMNSRHMLATGENRAQAMSIASRKMDEYLAKSFSGLPNTREQGSQRYHGIDYNWVVSIEERVSGVASEGNVIPYKHITVVCSYAEAQANGSFVMRDVRLVNIVAYPYIHSETYYNADGIGQGPEIPRLSAVTPQGGLGYRTFATLTFSPRVTKSVLVFYNISLDVQNANGVEGDHTVWTRCVLDGQQQDVVTRTPIMTQLSISNVVAINSVSTGEHTIQIQCGKDPFAGGTVLLKEINVIIIQIERPA